jgi:hypothetical protein
MNPRKRLAMVACLFMGFSLYAELARITVWIYTWWDAPMAVTVWQSAAADG